MHDLQRSYELVVLSVDQERCRLQRNLHDGLGPMLAGIGLAAQAARNLAPNDPQAADALLARVVADSGAATADVRRLVYDQRPLALDRLGLVEALREQVVRLRAPGEGASNEDLVVEIEASTGVDDLPAAVEVAAFRIALEAFVNVWRHANRASCTIRLTVDEALHIDVTDDGDGLAADARPGVGMASMQEARRGHRRRLQGHVPEGWRHPRPRRAADSGAEVRLSSATPAGLTGRISRSHGTQDP